MEGLKKREQISEVAEKTIRRVREVFQEKGLRVFLDGSRMRGVSTKESDFDLKVILDVADNLNKDELLKKFQEHNRIVNETVYKNFPGAKVRDKEMWISFRDGEGNLFSIIPKLSFGGSYEGVFFPNKNKDGFTIDRTISSIKASKEKNRQTNGLYKETVIKLKELLLEKYNLTKGGFVVESLLALVEPNFYLEPENEKERLKSVIKRVLEIINQENDLPSLGYDVSEDKIFKSDFVRDEAVRMLSGILADL